MIPTIVGGKSKLLILLIIRLGGTLLNTMVGPMVHAKHYQVPVCISLFLLTIFSPIYYGPP